MGFDSRERDGRRDVSAALAGRHGCKGGTSTQQLFFGMRACTVRQKGRWHSTSDKKINVSVRSGYSEKRKEEEEEEARSWRNRCRSG